jgi:exodeoxyribonuclease-3
LPGLPEDDAQARYIEIETADMTLIGIYLPNGNSRGDEGFAYKLAWMDRLAERAQTLLDADRPFVIAGDFNVAPTDEDYAPGALSPTDALVRPESRARYRRMIWMGLTDAIRAVHPTGPVYTFWDYQAGAWQRDSGLRIDHVLLSPTLAERLVSAESDREERAQTQPSDHVPVIVELK